MIAIIILILVIFSACLLVRLKAVKDELDAYKQLCDHEYFEKYEKELEAQERIVFLQEKVSHELESLNNQEYRKRTTFVRTSTIGSLADFAIEGIE